MKADHAQFLDSLHIPEPTEVTARLHGFWTKIRNSLRKRDNQLLWGIILIAALLRLSYLDLIEFKADESQHLLRAARLIEGGEWPLVGTSASIGIAKPPLMVYLMAVPLLLGRDPRIASAFISLLNVAAVAGLFLVARQYYGRRVAALSALLLATNPWAIMYSRKVFTADLLLPFGLLSFWGLLRALIDRRPWGWVLACFGLGLSLYLTFSPWPLVLAWFVLIIVYRSRVSWAHLVFGVCLVILLFAPYLYHLNTAGQDDLKGALRDLVKASAGTASAPASRAFQYAAWLHSGHQFSSLAGASIQQFAPARSVFAPLDGIQVLLFLASLGSTIVWVVYSWSHWRQQEDAAKYVIPMVWMWLPLLFWTAARSVLQLHYLIVLYPVGFLSMGLLIDRLLSLPYWPPFRRHWWTSFIMPVIGLFLLVLIVWQSYSVFYLYDFVTRHDTSGGYGIPFRYWRRTAASALRQAESAKVDQVWVMTQGADVAYEEAPLVLHYLLGPRVGAVFMGQGANDCLLLPAGRPAVYLLTRDSEPVAEALYQLGAQERSTVLFPDQHTRARVLVAEARSAEQLLAMFPHRELWAFDWGLRLLGYGWPTDAKAGQRVRLSTYWSFADVPDEARFVQHSLFNHLLDQDGRKLAQRDGFGLPERYWTDGLVLAQWFDLQLPAEVPAGQYTLLTGVYRLSDFARSRVIDDAGYDIGDSVALGPLSVSQ
jgi:4-amino-4-deoxy-L-arabinose transferase-like glycosyltransferase